MALSRALLHRRLLAGGAALALIGVSPAARAQVSVQRFQPAPGPRNFPTVETARVAGDMAFSVGLFADYARTPFRLRHCLPGPCANDGATVDRVDVVKNLVTANLLASLTPLPRLQLGLRVPVAYASGQGIDTDPASATYGQGLPGGSSGFTMGDPAVEVKVRALGQATSPVTAGVSLSVSAPVAHAMAPALYVGDTSPVGELRAIVDADLGRFFFAANAGGALRSAEHLGSFDLGPEARAGLGAGVRVTPPVRLMAQGFASTNFTTAPGTSAGEADLAAQWAPERSHVVVTLGGGAGLNEGVGVPLFRAFLGVGYEVERTRAAAAPVDPDVDKDKIANEEDRCPREGGDVVRLPGRFYGCPKRDSDGDGVDDALDACPDKPGEIGKDAARNGCPSSDRDADGIPNDQDKCPDKAETYNAFEDQDGCPDEPPVRVEVRNDQIVVINEHINFDFNSNQIVGKRSFQALDLVAQALQEHPEIKKVEVAGYTDNVGPRETNMDYSRRRAAAVVTYLVSKGVDSSRLVSVGYGPDKPVASNDTAEGRAENRRVQFNILMMFK
jgi:outer membrane protein OmpA-like peptidoglycan-associated protein